MGTRLARLIFIGGLVVWVANAGIRYISTPPLGHDEARYATDTRDLLEGRGKRYLYVPIGMNAIAAPGVLAGGDERALRVLPVLAGFLFLLSAWRLAKELTSSTTAHWVVGVLAGAHPMVRFSADLLSDLPSAACLLTALGILMREVTRPDGPRNRIIVAAPLLAAGFYVRYGSCATIFIIVLVSLALGGKKVLRRPLPVLWMLALLAALLTPHVIYAVGTTGTPTGILRISAEIPGHAGEGLSQYFAGNVFALYGVLVAPVMLVGLLALRRNGVIIALKVIALAQIVALGLSTHAQSRFVFLATVLLVIVGIDECQRYVTSFSVRTRTALVTIATFAVVAGWVGGLVSGILAHTHRNARSEPTLLAASQVRADANGKQCEILGRRTAQLAWYSGCRSILSVSPESLSSNGLVYLVREHADSALTSIDNMPTVKCSIARSEPIVDVFRLLPLGSTCPADAH